MGAVSTEEALSPFGELVLTAYGIWPDAAPPEIAFPRDLWPPSTSCDAASLGGGDWAVSVWDIRPGRWPVTPWPDVLEGTLQQLQRGGAVVAWFALEGGFADPPALFDPDQTDSANYAVLAEGMGFRCTAFPGATYRGVGEDILRKMQTLVRLAPAFG